MNATVKRSEDKFAQDVSLSDLAVRCLAANKQMDPG